MSRRVFTVAGFNFAGTGQNSGLLFIQLQQLGRAAGSAGQPKGACDACQRDASRP